MKKKDKLSFDVIVIGASLSGSVAALQAVQSGLTVLLIEKSKSVGGSGNYVEGIFAVNSYLQAQQGIKVSEKDILNEELNYSHYLADPMIWKDYLSESAKNIEWLKNIGVKYIKVLEQANGFQTWHLFEGLGKQVIQNILLPLAQQNGARILTSAAVRKININEHGVIGASVITAKSEIDVNSKAVILATDGYLNNSDLLDKVVSHKIPILPVNSGHNKGDGLKLADNIGAQKNKLGILMLCGGTIKDLSVPAYQYREEDLCIAAAKQGMLWVNERGNRFVNEGIVSNFAYAGNTIISQNRVFSILDKNTVDRLTCGPIPRTMDFGNGKVTSLTKLKTNISAYLGNNSSFISCAESLDELAKELKLPNLVKTVRRYNKMCYQKQDDDFSKPVQYLLPLRKGPFYAVELAVGAFCTIGGLKVTRSNEVLNDYDEPISGLYAIGNDGASALVGDTYGINVPGTEAGYAVYSGRNSVRQITAKLSEKK